MPSAEIKTIRLMITPQTKVNISDNEKWLLAPTITDVYLLKVGVKKNARDVENKTKKITSKMYYVKRRAYILRYLNYKRKLKEIFFKSGLKEFPQDNVWFYFYIPIPPSWSKKKRNANHLERHQNVPDASNFHKAMEDACSDKDRRNWDYRASKFWIDSPEGYIVIELGSLPPAMGYKKITVEDILK